MEKEGRQFKKDTLLKNDLAMGLNLIFFQVH